MMNTLKNTMMSIRRQVMRLDSLLSLTLDSIVRAMLLRAKIYIFFEIAKKNAKMGNSSHF